MRLNTIETKLIFSDIDDLDIPKLQIYRQLRDNATTKDNSFIADSPMVVTTLLKTDIEIKSILATKKYYDENEKLINAKNIPNLYLADKALLKNIVGHNIHHGVMMHGIRPKEVSFEKLDKHIVMLDALSKNENVGAISRSAAALGINSLLFPEKSPHPYGRKALRVSMGEVSKLKLRAYVDTKETIQTLQSLGYKVFAAETTSDAVELQKVKVPQKWVLLMGDEAHGIQQEILDICDCVVKIEMQEDVKSFNVAAAAAILMYKFKVGS